MAQEPSKPSEYRCEGKDLLSIQQFIYSNCSDSTEWKAAEEAFQKILKSPAIAARQQGLGKHPMRCETCHNPVPERVLLCFGNYLECPIDEEECKVSGPCHDKAICDKKHDDEIAQAAREDERNRVITAFIEKGYTRIETVAPLEGIHLGWVLLSDVKSCLESLRATTQAPGNRPEPEKKDGE